MGPARGGRSWDATAPEAERRAGGESQILETKSCPHQLPAGGGCMGAGEAAGSPSFTALASPNPGRTHPRPPSSGRFIISGRVPWGVRGWEWGAWLQAMVGHGGTPSPGPVSRQTPRGRCFLSLGKGSAGGGTPRAPHVMRDAGGPSAGPQANPRPAPAAARPVGEHSPGAAASPPSREGEVGCAEKLVTGGGGKQSCAGAGAGAAAP